MYFYNILLISKLLPAPKMLYHTAVSSIIIHNSAYPLSFLFSRYKFSFSYSQPLSAKFKPPLRIPRSTPGTSPSRTRRPSLPLPSLILPLRSRSRPAKFNPQLRIPRRGHDGRTRHWSNSCTLWDRCWDFVFIGLRIGGWLLGRRVRGGGAGVVCSWLLLLLFGRV
jgi:hypothetical protein